MYAVPFTRAGVAAAGTKVERDPLATLDPGIWFHTAAPLAVSTENSALTLPPSGSETGTDICGLVVFTYNVCAPVDGFVHQEYCPSRICALFVGLFG